MKKVIWFLVIVLIIILAFIWNRPASAPEQQAAATKTQDSAKTSAVGPVTVAVFHGGMLYGNSGRDSYQANVDRSTWVVGSNTSGALAVITEVGVGIVSAVPNTVNALRIGNIAQPFPVTNEFGLATGLNVPFSGNGNPIGFGITAYFNPVSASIPSGTDVKYVIKYMKYTLNGSTYTICDPSYAVCNYDLSQLPKADVTSPIMKRVGSIITTPSGGSRMSVVPATSSLANGVNKLVDITFDTNIAYYGQLRLKQIPIRIVSTGTANVPMATGNLKITSGTNSCATGINLIQNTSFALPANGTVDVMATFPSNGVLIMPGTGSAVTFHVCATNVSGVGGTATKLTTTLGPSSGFKWQDVTGNNPGFFDVQNTQFFQGYPTTASVISNSTGGTTSN
jgi:hypothetical protein